MSMNSGTTIDIAALFDAHEAERFSLHTRHLNEQMVRVLRTIGYDVGFCKGRGQYLYDRDGRPLSRPAERLRRVRASAAIIRTIRAALKSVLDADLPNLVQMDVSTLAGILAERLLALVPHLDKVFFANSGAESVEAAIKFARAATGRPGIVYCSHAFHGLTYGALSLNGDEIFRKRLRAAAAGLRAHSVQRSRRAGAGARLAPASRRSSSSRSRARASSCRTTTISKAPQHLCRRYGTLFVADEIQTGLGRTGKFLAVEHWGIEPDMVLLAKALSGGHVPVGAVLMRKGIFDKVFNRMDRAVVHGSTFSKNDLAMAAGIATLDVHEGRARDRECGAHRRAAAARPRPRWSESYELLKEVRGKGLMIGVEFGAPSSLKLKASWNVLETASKGLFCQLITIPLFKEHKILTQVAGHGSHTIKLLPPLIINDEDCDWIVRAFDEVIADSHRPGAVWSLGKTLVEHAMRPRA